MRNVSILDLLLLWSFYTSDGSAVVIDLEDTNSNMSLNILTSPIEVKPKISVEIPAGKAADLHCSEGLAKWWQTPFGSFGERIFSANDPISIKNGTLRILRATPSHSGFYSCFLVDSRGTTVFPYQVNIMDENKNQRSLGASREAETSMVYELASGVAPSVLVTFAVAFTLGAFSQPYVIKCLQKTRARTGNMGLLRISTIQKPSWFEDSSKSSKPPTKWTWSKDKQDEVHMDEAHQVEDEPEEARSTPEGEEIRKTPKRRSRVIKVYNYDEEGKKYDHISEPELVVEEFQPGPRQRVMSLTRLNTIMKQVETPDFSTSRKSIEKRLDAAEDSPQI